MASYAVNLDKALKIINKNKEYLETLEKQGYHLPEYYKTYMKELEDIKNDPNRKGISNDKLEHIRYLFNKNVINSRKSYNIDRAITTFSPEGTDLELPGIKGSGSIDKTTLNKFGKKLYEMYASVADNLDPNKFPNAQVVLRNEAFENMLNALGIYDFSKLSDVAKKFDINTVESIVQRAISVINASPVEISPFEHEIRSAWGEKGHVRTLRNFGWDDDEIEKLEQFIDHSSFWAAIRKANLESNQKTNVHEIKDFTNTLISKINSGLDSDNLRKLKTMFANGTDANTIEDWLKTI